MAEEQRDDSVGASDYQPTAATRIPCQYNEDPDDGFRMFCTPPGLKVQMPVNLTFHSLFRVGRFCGRKTSLNCSPECRAYLSDPKHHDCSKKEGCDRWISANTIDQMKAVASTCARLILASPRKASDEIVEDDDIPMDPVMDISGPRPRR